MPEFPLPPLTMVFLCFMVGLAGFVDSSAGGGGLIALPAYMAAGLPMHTVYACNKTSSAIGTTFSTLRFLKNGAADLKVGLLAAATSFLGAGLASQVVLLIPDAALRVVLLILLPVAAVIIFTRRAVADEDRSDRLSGTKKWLIAAAIGFFIGGYDGLIGPGTGTFAIIAFSTLMGYDLRKSSGNAKLLNLASNYASVITVVTAGKVLWAVALPCGLCGIVGHLLGSGMALKKGARFIRPMMIVVLCLLLADLAKETFFA